VLAFAVDKQCFVFNHAADNFYFILQKKSFVKEKKTLSFCQGTVAPCRVIGLCILPSVMCLPPIV